MKALFKKKQYNEEIAAFIGYYNEEGTYREERLEKLSINELPPKIRNHIYLKRDITIHIAPQEEIRIFAKSLDVIDSYFVEEKTTSAKELLDVFSMNPRGMGEYLYMTVDLEEMRKIRELT
jgi:hypothetical protein